MHYIDKAREIQRELKKRNITAYEYARLQNVHSSIFSNYTRLLRLGERVLKHVMQSTIGISKATQLLRLRDIKDDEYLIRIIKLDKVKKFRLEKFKAMVNKELERG